MSEVFKKGDIVQLKSGGPKMTINNYTDGSRVFCKWFNSKNEVQSEVFQQEALVLATETTVPPTTI